MLRNDNFDPTVTGGCVSKMPMRQNAIGLSQIYLERQFEHLIGSACLHISLQCHVIATHGAHHSDTYPNTSWVLEQGRHAALDQNRSVFQQRSNEPPSGQLTQQISQELHKSLTVQQLLLVLRGCQVCCL